MPLSKYMALVSRYKTPLMGLSIFAIVLCHTGILLPGALGYLKFGLWAVNIFFFLSGMGAYRSLSRNDDTAAFYSRRFNRIYIPYFPIIILYFLTIGAQTAALYGVPGLLWRLFGNLTMLGWVGGMDGQFNWYPQALALVYLISPALFSLVKRYGADTKKLTFIFLFTLVSQLCFIGSSFLIATSRFVFFVLGMVCSEVVTSGREIKLPLPLLLIGVPVGHFIMYKSLSLPEEISWKYGLQWLPDIFSVLGNMLILCKFFEFCEKRKMLRWLMAVNQTAGRFSFEIFLVHILVFLFVPMTDIEAFSIPGGMNILLWCAVSVFAVFCGIGYGKLIEKVRKKVK